MNNHFTIGDLVTYDSGIYQIKSVKNTSIGLSYQLELLSNLAHANGGYPKNNMPVQVEAQESKINKFTYKPPAFKIGSEVRYYDERYKIFSSLFENLNYYYNLSNENMLLGGIKESDLR